MPCWVHQGQGVVALAQTLHVEPYVERMACLPPCLAPSGSTRRRRNRGEIETRPSGSLRVRVYAGIDPTSGRRHYLTEVVPAGKDAGKLAEKARNADAGRGR